jgi:hypothetical protein
MVLPHVLEERLQVVRHESVERRAARIMLVISVRRLTQRNRAVRSRGNRAALAATPSMQGRGARGGPSWVGSDPEHEGASARSVHVGQLPQLGYRPLVRRSSSFAARGSNHSRMTAHLAFVSPFGNAGSDSASSNQPTARSTW